MGRRFPNSPISSGDGFQEYDSQRLCDVSGVRLHGREDALRRVGDAASRQGAWRFQSHEAKSQEEVWGVGW